MYSNKDYIENFLKVDVTSLSKEQLVELFVTCIRHDSFKIALQLYLHYLTTADLTSKIMENFLLAIRDSVCFHEIKLYFILENFDVLTIEQLNHLVDILIKIFNRRDYRQNPMLSQVNTVKVSLLVYRISWKIEQKKIYSLITKCEMVNEYIFTSLQDFLSRQNNIA